MTEPVTVTVARWVAPGREVEFEDWADRLTAAAARYDGFLGAGLLRPGRLGEDWHVVYRFDSPDHLDTWQRSPARAALMAEGEAVMRTTGTSVRGPRSSECVQPGGLVLPGRRLAGATVAPPADPGHDLDLNCYLSPPDPIGLRWAGSVLAGDRGADGRSRVR